MEKDTEHKLYMLYPEGNWIEIGEATPFTIIGNSGYGKPILNRALDYESSIPFSLKTGFLSFDSTRVSANDVGYPLDVVVYQADTDSFTEKRLQEEDTGQLGELWGQKLTSLIHEIPDTWTDVLLPKEYVASSTRQLQQQQQQQQ